MSRVGTAATGPIAPSAPSPSAADLASGTPPRKRRGRAPRVGPKAKPKPQTTRPGAGLAGSPDAKRKASVILEVLGGLRSPVNGSAVLNVSVQRYYQLEVRALQGLVAALDVKPARGGPTPETAQRRLAAERDRLERELLRAQALLRLAQRAVGLPPPEAGSKPSAAKPGSGKRPRRPTVRARRAADELRAACDSPGEAAATVPAAPAPAGSPAPA